MTVPLASKSNSQVQLVLQSSHVLKLRFNSHPFLLSSLNLILLISVASPKEPSQSLAPKSQPQALLLGDQTQDNSYPDETQWKRSYILNTYKILLYIGDTVLILCRRKQSETKSHTISKTLKHQICGLPWWLSDKEYSCEGWRHRFNP